MNARELAAFVPDCIVLLKRLIGDPRVPRRAKVALALLVPYLASPIDLIPDFLPGIGQLDDALLLVAALRYVVRLAGRDVVTELWPGSPGGLRLVLAAATAPSGT
ncbi:MAG: YkvA family protein [Gaiellaceae bacterium]